jgi:hypothetical protein
MELSSPRTGFTAHQRHRLFWEMNPLKEWFHGIPSSTVISIYTPISPPYSPKEISLTNWVVLAAVLGKTAPSPGGPWSDEIHIYDTSEFAFVYRPSQQYRYDPPGENPVVSYTGYPNILQAINVVSSTEF